MNVGLIGLGRHGKRYAHHLLAPQSPARLVAVCRRDVEQGEAFAQKTQLRFHQHYRALIKDPEVEAIIVVAPPSLTLPIAIEAIRHNKPLLIEKPFAVSSKDARQIVNKASQSLVPLMIAYTLRYDETIRTLKEYAKNIGLWQYLSLTARLERRPHTLEEIRAWRGRGALLEFGVHLLDLARFLTDEEIREVHCEKNQPEPEAPEDQIWGRLTTQSGMPCLLDISRVSESRLTRIELIGESGQLSADWTTGTLSLQRERNLPEEFKRSPTATIQHVLNDWVQALKAGAPMPITGKDGLQVLEIAEACYESAMMKRPITLLQ